MHNNTHEISKAVFNVPEYIMKMMQNVNGGSSSPSWFFTGANSFLFLDLVDLGSKSRDWDLQSAVNTKLDEES